MGPGGGGHEGHGRHEPRRRAAPQAGRHHSPRDIVFAFLADEEAPADAPPGGAPYLDGLGDALVALAEAGTWCWAPHDRFAAARGELLPDPGRPFLDLGAAETAALVAWADHVLGERLERRLPGLRRWVCARSFMFVVPFPRGWGCVALLGRHRPGKGLPPPGPVLLHGAGRPRRPAFSASV